MTSVFFLTQGRDVVTSFKISQHASSVNSPVLDSTLSMTAEITSTVVNSEVERKYHIGWVGGLPGIAQPPVLRIPGR